MKLIMLTISFFVFMTKSIAQCAGSDNSIIICNKESYNQGIGNPNGVVNLFTLLGVGAVSGGTWSNLNGAGGFNASTGILNLYQTLQGGVYNFQYTVNGIPGCTNNTATIEITLNGYAGVGTGGNLCTNDSPVNLKNYFDLTNYPSPDSNGVFTISGNIISNIFNPNTAGPGNYLITYTTPSFGNCPISSTTFPVSVEQAPNAGTPTPLLFCETDEFSLFTNVNLLNQLNGQDSGGNWLDISSTGEISNTSDTFINIQNIYNNFGPGTYIFRYNVNAVFACDPSNADILIIIEPVVDINGANLTIAPTPICFENLNTTILTGTITQGANPIPDGTYDITYVLSGVNSGTETVSITFTGGIATFAINPTFVNNIGLTTIDITNIINSSSVTNCTRTITNLNSSFEIAESPNVNDTQISVSNFCVGETGQVVISDINNSNIELSDDRYIITYTITDPNGLQTTETIVILVTNGDGIFSILNSLTSIAGNYTITITNIENEYSGCSTATNLSTPFIVYPIPNASNLIVSIGDVCFGDDVIVSLSGANNLPDGLYDLNYNIVGAINVNNQVANNVNFTNGSASFILSNGILNIGTSTFTLNSLTSVTTICGTNTFNSASDDFEILPLPNATNATITASDICISETETIFIQNANGLLDGEYTIIYDLTGANISTANSVVVTFTGGNTQFIIPSVLLENGGLTTITIQTLINNTTGCGTNDLSNNPVSFTITDPGVPTLATDGNLFCLQDLPNPTIANLTANITSIGTITWYDAPSNGNMYTSTDPITNGTTYYASLTDGQGCEGSLRLEVVVDLTSCPNLFIPDGFSPNNDGLNDTFYIKDIDIIYPNFALEIYNRYGNLVYKGDINTPDFNGKPNQTTVLGNDILPTGVYFYILNYNDSTNKKPTQGRLYLSR